MRLFNKLSNVFVLALLISGCTGGFASLVMVPESSNYGKNENFHRASTSSPYGSMPGDDIDVLDFMISKHPDKSLGVSQIVFGNWAFETKWTSNDFEVYTWDDNYIYLVEDHDYYPESDSQGVVASPGIFAKRHMKIGETMTTPQNVLTMFGPNCQPKGTMMWSSQMTLVAHIPDFDAGPELGIQDVIVTQTWGGYDHNLYSREWGWIGYSNTTNQFTPFAKRDIIARPNLDISCLGKTTGFSPPSLPAGLGVTVGLEWQGICASGSVPSGNTCIDGTAVPVQFVPILPAPPASLTAYCNGDGTATFAWPSVSGASSYLLFVYDNQTNTYLYNDPVNFNASASPVTASVPSGHSVSSWVYAENSAGQTGRTMGNPLTCGFAPAPTPAPAPPPAPMPAPTPAPAPQAPAPVTIDPAVRQLYLNVLGREPDSAGGVNATIALQDGTATLQSLRDNMAYSAEMVSIITNDYNQILPGCLNQTRLAYWQDWFTHSTALLSDFVQTLYSVLATDPNILAICAAGG